MIGLIDFMSTQGAVPIGDIVGIDEERRSEHRATTRRVHMRGGVAFDFLEHEVRELFWRPVQIIPAVPGTSVVSAYTGQEHGGPEILHDTVIAWALCVDGNVRPVTPEGVKGSHLETVYVELPHGAVEGVGEYNDPSGFPDAKHMLAHFLSEAAKWARGEATVTGTL